MLHFNYISFDSSVGRAVDCSCIVTDIHRSLVQIRLEGIFVFWKNNFKKMFGIHPEHDRILVESIKYLIFWPLLKK